MSGLAAINYNNYWCRPNYNELDKSHDNIITVYISLMILLSMNGSGIDEEALIDGLPCPVLLLTLWCSLHLYTLWRRFNRWAMNGLRFYFYLENWDPLFLYLCQSIDQTQRMRGSSFVFQSFNNLQWSLDQ